MTREQIEALMGLEKKATAREWNRVCNVLTGLWCIGRIEEHTAKQLGGSADSELACELRNAAPDLFRLALYGLAAEKVVVNNNANDDLHIRRIHTLEAELAAEREAVRVLAHDKVHGVADMIGGDVCRNPIASAAVRKAGENQ